MSEPGGDCPHCGHTFASHRGLLLHSHGPCRDGNPRPPTTTGRRMECPVCSLRHTPRCQPIRWDIAPLIATIGSFDKLAAALDMNHHKIRGFMKYGIDDFQADRWAIRCGFHPASVWPEWIDAGLTVVDRQRLDNGWRRAWLHADRPELRERAA